LPPLYTHRSKNAGITPCSGFSLPLPIRIVRCRLIRADEKRRIITSSYPSNPSREKRQSGFLIGAAYSMKLLLHRNFVASKSSNRFSDEAFVH
jgi:hypothetical protein